MEAVKQGSATVGVKSNTHAVLVALKRASSELSRCRGGAKGGSKQCGQHTRYYRGAHRYTGVNA